MIDISSKEQWTPSSLSCVLIHGEGCWMEVDLDLRYS